mmetsp:Transcript_11749/g.26920  ORF Transcript_11749/g.26920 Transcript_11749/m.26920 type:complete len:295 (+) Transcript_11749:4108-4992(+)
MFALRDERPPKLPSGYTKEKYMASRGICADASASGGSVTRDTGEIFVLSSDTPSSWVKCLVTLLGPVICIPCVATRSSSGWPEGLSMASVTSRLKFPVSGTTANGPRLVIRVTTQGELKSTASGAAPAADPSCPMHSTSSSSGTAFSSSGAKARKKSVKFARRSASLPYSTSPNNSANTREYGRQSPIGLPPARVVGACSSTDGVLRAAVIRRHPALAAACRTISRAIDLPAGPRSCTRVDLDVGVAALKTISRRMSWSWCPTRLSGTLSPASRARRGWYEFTGSVTPFTSTGA